MNAVPFVSTSAKIPVTKALDCRKWMFIWTENSARINFLEKNSFVWDLVIRYVIRQRDLRYINAFCFLFIKPVRICIGSFRQDRFLSVLSLDGFHVLINDLLQPPSFSSRIYRFPHPPVSLFSELPAHTAPCSYSTIPRRISIYLPVSLSCFPGVENPENRPGYANYKQSFEPVV